MGKRAEMRREKHRNNATYTLTADQIQRIKDEAIQEATNTAFKLMLGIPTIVIHDKFGKLMRKERREETFVDLILDVFDSYSRGYLTLDDIDKVLRDEGGIVDMKEVRKTR